MSAYLKKLIMIVEEKQKQVELLDNTAPLEIKCIADHWELIKLEAIRFEGRDISILTNRYLSDFIPVQHTPLFKQMLRRTLNLHSTYPHYDHLIVLTYIKFKTLVKEEAKRSGTEEIVMDEEGILFSKLEQKNDEISLIEKE